MKAYIDNIPITLTDNDIIGQGGEAVIYEYKNQALKIYHKDYPYKKLKILKIKQFPKDIHPAVIGPVKLVKGSKDVIGFTMPVIRGAKDALFLTKKKYRDGLIEDHQVVTLFKHIHECVGQLHHKNIIIGDFNYTNVLYKDTSTDLSFYLIDADSMQYGSCLCVVAHELFLDPILYGKSFDKTQIFTNDSDWYAYAVMLFMSKQISIISLSHP